MSKVQEFCYFWIYQKTGGIPIGFLNKGDVLRDVGVKIDDAMNDASGSISVGTIDQPELFVKKEDVVASVYGDYRIPEAHESLVDTSIYAFVAPLSSIRGHGSIYFTIVRKLS